MKEIEIAMTNVVQVDKYWMQLRSGDKTKGAIGLVGCFGGAIEPGETARQAAARELGEETNIKLAPEHFHYLDSHTVISDRENEEVEIKADVYEILLPQDVLVQIKEGHGELIGWTRADIINNESALSPATKSFFRKYFNGA